jgi:hypothetical protein
VKAEPGTYVRNCFYRLYLLWQPRSWSDAANLQLDFSEYRTQKRYTQLVIKGAMLCWDALLVVLAAVGLVLAVRERHRFAYVLVTILYCCAVYSVLYGYARYRVPLIPLMSVLAAYSVVQLSALIPVLTAWTRVTSTPGEPASAVK